MTGVARRRWCRRTGWWHRSDSWSQAQDTGRTLKWGRPTLLARGCDGGTSHVCVALNSNRQGTARRGKGVTHSCTSLKRSALGSSLRLSAAERVTPEHAKRQASCNHGRTRDVEEVHRVVTGARRDVRAVHCGRVHPRVRRRAVRTLVHYAPHTNTGRASSCTHVAHRTCELSLPQRLCDVVQEAYAVRHLNLSHAAKHEIRVRRRATRQQTRAGRPRLENEVLPRCLARWRRPCKLRRCRVGRAHRLETLLEQTPRTAIQPVARANLRSPHATHQQGWSVEPVCCHCFRQRDSMTSESRARTLNIRKDHLPSVLKSPRSTTRPKSNIVRARSQPKPVASGEQMRTSALRSPTGVTVTKPSSMAERTDASAARQRVAETSGSKRCVQQGTRCLRPQNARQNGRRNEHARAAVPSERLLEKPASGDRLKEHASGHCSWPACAADAANTQALCLRPRC